MSLDLTAFSLAVPSNAEITGIEVEHVSSMSGTLPVLTLTLWKAGVPVGLIRGSAVASTLTRETFGSRSDLWETTWTPAEVNASNFGVSFTGRCDGTSAESASFEVDVARITVYTLDGIAHVSLPMRAMVR